MKTQLHILIDILHSDNSTIQSIAGPQAGVCLDEKISKPNNYVSSQPLAKLYFSSENDVCRTTFITGSVIKRKAKNTVLGLFWLLAISNNLVFVFFFVGFCLALFLFFKISDDIFNISKYLRSRCRFLYLCQPKGRGNKYSVFLQPQFIKDECSVLSQVLFGSVGLAKP